MGWFREQPVLLEIQVSASFVDLNLNLISLNALLLTSLVFLTHNSLISFLAFGGEISGKCQNELEHPGCVLSAVQTRVFGLASGSSRIATKGLSEMFKVVFSHTKHPTEHTC